jgi:predicted ABC-type ATPase
VADLTLEVAESHVLAPHQTGCREVRALGGKGSGNFGHKGRPGEVGGSASDGTSLSPKAQREQEKRKQQELADAQENPLAHPMVVLGRPHLFGIENYVAAYGEEFTPTPLPEDVERGPMGQCYRNATLLVLSRPDLDLDFAEGFAQSSGTGSLSFMHAWAVTKDGKVLDPTWDKPEDGKYFGVRYDRRSYLKDISRRKYYGVLGANDKGAQKVIDTGGVKLRSKARQLGGPGSGNFGHAGRPGQVGGSSTSDVAFTRFESQVLGVLQKQSRTVGQFEDQGVKTNKPSLIIEGKKAGDLADLNARKALRMVWAKDTLTSPEDAEQFVISVNRQLTEGMLQPGQSHLRTWETPYEQTPPNQIEEGLKTFGREFYHRMQQDDAVATAAWVEQVLDAQLHPFADAVGRTTKVISNWVLDRAGLPSPTYPPRIEYYKQITKPLATWTEYYRSLFEPKTAEGIDMAELMVLGHTGEVTYLDANMELTPPELAEWARVEFPNGEIVTLRALGGPGSGNFGHAGRPGEVGGSAPDGVKTFHGTSQKKLDSILKDGLQASYSGVIWPNQSKPGLVYMSTNMEEAQAWAIQTVDREFMFRKRGPDGTYSFDRGQPVVLEVTIPEKELTRVANDEHFPTEGDYAVRESNNRQFQGDIKPEWITGVWKGEVKGDDATWMRALAAHVFYVPFIIPVDEPVTLGGKGSGNFGHAGRPGQVGGSSSTGSPRSSSFKRNAVAIDMMSPIGDIRADSYASGFVQLYHVTDIDSAESISKEGFDRHAKNQFQGFESARKAVYGWSSRDRARLEVQRAEEMSPGSAKDFAIVQFQVPKAEWSKLHADEDAGPVDWKQSYGEMSAAFEGDVPPRWINAVFVDHEALKTLGGKGSGNFGHKGRPGEIGGSAPSTSTPAGLAKGQNETPAIKAILDRPSSFYPKTKQGPNMMQVDHANDPDAAHDQPRGFNTLQQHTLPNGSITPERRALHEAIVEKMLGDHSKPEGRPIAHLMGGGGASGKSVIQAQLTLPEDQVHVDVDIIRTHLPEWDEELALAKAEGRKANNYLGNYTHEEASLISKMVIDRASRDGLNLMVDGTGDTSVDKVAQNVARYKVGGQKVIADYVTVDYDMAYARMRERGDKTGRYIPAAHLRAVHQEVARVFPAAVERGLFDEFTLWDTSNGKPGVAAKPTKVASGRGKNITIHDQDAWDKFMARGKGIAPRSGEI